MWNTWLVGSRGPRAEGWEWSTPVQAIWRHNFREFKNVSIQPRLLYPAKLSFRIKGQIKSSPDKKNVKEFNTKPVLQEMLEALL